MRKHTILTAGCFALLSVFVGQSAFGQLIAADDFLYNQATKPFGSGGGFQQQEYSGGANGPAGQWTSAWVSTGDGVITGSDISEENGFVLETDQFLGATSNGLSENHLQRGFSLTDTASETIFFGVTLRNREAAATTPLFTLNDPGGESQISMGFLEGGLVGILGEITEQIDGPEITDGADPYQLVGKLELNASADDERLTVWLDPTGVEEAEESFSVEADVLASFEDLAGVLRLDHNASGQVVYWDDVALAADWDSATAVNIPRATLLMDPETNEVAIVNGTESELDMIYYDVTSASDGIATENWATLEGQNEDGWVASPATPGRLIESNLRGSTPLGPGQQVRLGTIATSDLAGSVATSTGLLNILNVEMGPIESGCNPNTLGDFDGNGAVEFADFLTLSSNFGLAVADHTGGDADCNGTVEFADFLTLSSNFGTTVGGAESVPEPNAFGLLGLASCLCLVTRRRRG